MSKNADISFIINGQNVDYSLETFDISIEASFDADNIQPNLNIEDINLYGKSVIIVEDWINAGKFYKGIPIQIGISNNNGSRNIFDGYIDLPKNYENIEDGTIRVGLVKKNGLNTLNDRLASITWSMLIDKGIVTDSDYTSVNYIVEKSNPYLETLILNLMILVLTIEMYRELKKLIDNINRAITGAIPSVGFGVVENVGAILYAVLTIILEVIYLALMLFLILKMSIRIFNIIIRPERTHKCINYRIAMEILATHLGLNFVSPIVDLDYYHYLPSNINIDVVSNTGFGKIDIPKGIVNGVPHSGDFGFTGLEFVQILLAQFEAKLVIIGTDLIMRTKNDVYWQSQSTYIMPDVFVDKFETNAKDLIFSILIKYETDAIADEYTLSNFKGTNYQVLVNDTNVVQGADDNFIKKHETINLNVALGNRKDELSALEKIAKDLAIVIDGITRIFGGGTNFVNKIKNRVGRLKVGTNNHEKPKCLYLIDGKLPLNHRDLTSAKYLWENYINNKSFVANNMDRQQQVFEVKDIPLGMEDFLKTIDNSYFLTSNNEKAKIDNSKWNILNDRATIKFKKKLIFAPSLYETYIEQS